MLKQVITILLFFIYLPVWSFAQNKAGDSHYAIEWVKIDSLLEKGLPKSARPMVEKILNDAMTKNDIPDKIKAQVYLINLKYENEEHALQQQIKASESLAGKSSGVEKAIWQNLTAGLYWNYYEQNRYELYNRTKLEQTTSDDIETWDAVALINRIAELYEASIEDKTLLQSTPVGQYEPIISKGINTKALRPTLYDLLAFKAIDFFQDEEATVTKVADAFQIDGSLWFEPANKFSAVRVKVKDGSSFKFRTLRLFQDLIAFHLNDTKPEALIDADLQRLEFVHANSVNAQKDSLYVMALQKIIDKFPASPSSAQALFLIAQQQMNEGENYVPVYRKMPKKKSNRNLPAIQQQLVSIISKFPKSEGAVNAQNLLNQINEVSLSLQAEQVNIPDENIKALVIYKNVPTVFLKLYKVPFKTNMYEYTSEDSLLNNIQKLQPLRTWQQLLPGIADLEQHSAEIKIDALPMGSYALIASSKENIADKDQIVTYSSFQVSGISFVAQQNNEKQGYVLNRKTGYPLSGVKLFYYNDSYQNSRTNYKLLGDGVSDENGMVHLPVYKNYDYTKAIRNILLVKGIDSVYIGGNINSYANEQSDNVHTQTFFFTDRSIYRPGQTLYFKGIMVKSSNGNRKNDVVANENTTVTLYDANNQKQASLQLKTNEFGSFSGTFQLPDGLMNGMMRISNENGSESFSVEEYKRPKFYVEFDTLKGSYALNEDVTVKGFAKAYAGNNVDGASVKYRVVRKTRFPYYWCYYYWGMPQATETEVANGNIVTAVDGSFEIPFKTMPDLSIEPKSMPLFYYEVYADVTDINGETRSGTQQLVSGYTSLQIVASIPEISKPKDLQQLSITTENLNNIFTSANVHIAISRLKFPGFFRKRIWSVPDQFVMTENEFHKAFPNDEYKEENNYLNWEIEKVLFEKNWTTVANGKLEVPSETWNQNGWYVIEIKTKDAQGHEIVEKKYTHVWAPGKKEPNQQPLIAFTEKESYEPGEKMELWLGTGIDNPYLVHTSSVQYKSTNPIRIDIQEKDRGGMTFSWLYVYDNRVYTIDKTINVPWSNKDLQIEWRTHRDKLQPGTKEQWTLTIKGNKKERVTSELLAGMYDASLDAFKPHDWNWQKLFPDVYSMQAWNDNLGFGLNSSRQLIYGLSPKYGYFEKRYDELISFENNYVTESAYGGRVMSFAAPAFDGTPGATAKVNERKSKVLFANSMDYKEDIEEEPRHMMLPEATTPNEQISNIPIRKNLQETAFFFPQLKTDSSGNVSFTFTMPEALTEWKMMAFAHTQDWKTGYLQGKVKTQKDLMVMPNMPRFLRQGDNIQFSTKIVNLSENVLKGNATIELLDAQTLQPVPFAQFMSLTWSSDEHDSKPFTVNKGQSTVASWNLHVPESRYTPVIVRITAKSGNFSDGEENTLPVITNRMLVTETLPVSINGNESKTYTLNNLVNNTSNTLLPHSLTVEFTGNPAWYAVQSLPYLMEYPYECAEQTFNRFYANALAQHIVAQSPKIQQIFNQWQGKDSAALISNLEKNEELKTALLEETPWVMEAQNETAQKHRVALLFQANKLSKEFKKTLEKLEQMQSQDGSFPWFKGMYGDRFITQYILTGMGRLQKLNVKNSDNNDLKQIYSKALHYTDAQMNDEYKELLKNKADMNLQHISNYQVQYLYMRSFYVGSSLSAENKKAFDYYKQQAGKYWSKFNPYMKGQIALALYRTGDAKTALQIMQSLKETAIQNEESGMYWKDMPRGYSWSEAPIESQSLLIEAFTEITKDIPSVEAMKLWLLKNKQTQNWNTTKATADACYALLLSGNDWLVNEPDVVIQLGNEKIKSSDLPEQAGTGYFKKRIAGKDITKDMGNIKVIVENSGSQNQVSWGAVYWQYFDQMDKIPTVTSTPVQLEKQLYKETNSDNGPVLVALTEGNKLQVGDKVKIRIVVKVDRDMEYVQLKDMRAACFEPVDVLSQYHYQSGIGYFQSTKDISTNFFFDHLSKGTYVFEYPVWVSAKGNYTNGITSIQCMYAPEFSSHTEGIRVEVK
ncbi:alpha-2-macroglobulin [Taibaiella lutea]|uniref:Alpha-2-macroglobulin n=1 Tax=Taibaiella lutea TaxID=2608001 RepID=A0A5M6CUX6_9BACT|nr:alpha-2-macroglobulin family protein [Taibaiella lutea]KAA5536999.1 alpha-2-macroglobulin [Taibaiella lutea]